MQILTTTLIFLIISILHLCAFEFKNKEELEQYILKQWPVDKIEKFAQANTAYNYIWNKVPLHGENDIAIYGEFPCPKIGGKISYKAIVSRDDNNNIVKDIHVFYKKNNLSWNISPWNKKMTDEAFNKYIAFITTINCFFSYSKINKESNCAKVAEKYDQLFLDCEPEKIQINDNNAVIEYNCATGEKMKVLIRDYKVVKIEVSKADQKCVDHIFNEFSKNYTTWIKKLSYL